MTAAKSKAPRKTPLKLSVRQEVALRFATAIAGSTIIFEVLDKADGKFTSQVNRIAFEMADDFLSRAAA